MEIQTDQPSAADEPEPEAATLAVVDAVAACENVDPVDLPPLYEAVDTDALNAVFRSLTDGEISFSYAGYDVTLHSDMRVVTQPR